MEEAGPLLAPTHVQGRVQPSFKAQFRAVFFKNLTLQARQRVSLALQLIPLIALLIAAGVVSVKLPIPTYPKEVNQCHSFNDPDPDPPICWQVQTYKNELIPSQYDWGYFWYHDGSENKLAGNCTRYGPLGPSFNGVLGYQIQFPFKNEEGWNQTANVPFFEEKPSWDDILQDYQILFQNYSQTVESPPYSWSSPYEYCKNTAPQYDPGCRLQFENPQAAVSFDRIDINPKKLDIAYRFAIFPGVSWSTPSSLKPKELLSTFNDLIYRWATNYTGSQPEPRVSASWSSIFVSVPPYPFPIAMMINPLLQILLWFLGFGLLIPFFMGKLVIEHGTGLMEVSKMAGLSTSAYWWSIICIDVIQLTIALLVCVIVGLGCQFTGLYEGGILMYLALFTYGLSTVSFAYLSSMFFKSLNWAYFFAYNAGLCNVALCATLNFFAFSGGVLPPAYCLWYPPLAASRAIFVLVHSSAEPWAVPMSLATKTAGWCIFWSLGMSMAFIIIPILPDLYKEMSQKLNKSKGNVTDMDTVNDSRISIDNGPVELDEELFFTHAPLYCKGISKAFVNENGDVISAVSNATFHIQTGDCFGLLGPNGAGKTTLINMLVGYLDPSSGDAFVDGHSVITNLTGVQRSIGLCPQFDIHYEDLTIREHLLYYSRLWGFTGENEKQHVKQLIMQIGLHDAKHTKASSLSGGQKRRLSIGIALSGNPPLVLLDEPSSGLDVGSQRGVWDIICNARKQNRSFLLTTHSMSEAEVLCNKIGVMSQGNLTVTGTPQQLKSKYGSGFKIDMLVDISIEEDLRAHPAYKFALDTIPEAELVSAMNGYLTFQIPKSVKLSKIITKIELGKKANGIINWGLSQSNLEEVFLALTRHESSEIDG